MTIGEAERLLAALSQARIDHPQLAVLLEMQEGLTVAQAAVGANLPPLELPDVAIMRARWSAGQAALTWEDLAVHWATFHALLDQQAEAVARHYPDLSQTVRDFADSEPATGRVAARAWYIGEEQTAAISGLLAAALYPWLARAAEAVRPHLDADLWRRETCPVCGGRADLAILEEKVGARSLCCARCDTRWDYPRLGCPFCGKEDPALQGYYASDNGCYRLFTCDSCHGYLKTLDLRQANRPVLLPLERILTLSMDTAAREQGYV